MMDEEKGLLLLVEDDALLRRIIARAFGPSFRVIEASDGDAGMELAREHSPDVVICDQRMPGRSGVEVLAACRQELPKAVRILITGYAEHRAIVDAVNAAGVHHYLEKPFHAGDLRTVVATLYKSARLERERDALLARLEDKIEDLGDQTEREELLEWLVKERTRDLMVANEELRTANERLVELTIRDGLTGLFNHRTLMEHLELELARSRRYEREFSLLFLDVDDFKEINDAHGHVVGDKVLEGLAKILEDGPHGVRKSDVCARYGGEEFCLILPETGLEGAVTKAERMLRRVSSHNWTHSVPIQRVSVSIGVASYPQHGESVAELLEAADRAMYTAKAAGKNRLALAGEGQPG